MAQATATEEGAAAQALNTARDLTRYRELQRTTPAAVAQQQIDQAVAAAAKGYQVYYAPQKTGTGPDDYLMDHSAALYLMSPAGKFVRIFGNNVTGDQLVAKLRPLLSSTS